MMQENQFQAQNSRMQWPRLMAILISLALAALGWYSFRIAPILFGSDLAVTRVSQVTIQPQVSTEQYIAAFDPKAYERAGTDYFNERYSPYRIGKPLNAIDTVYDFDFSYLNLISHKLEKVDRRLALKAIFDRVTLGATNNTERHLAVLKFLQKSSHHDFWAQPMYEDKQAVFDPLVLLEVGTMRCGAVARLGADLFDAAGYQVRLVQAVEHTTAEVFYDGRWHLFEADLNGGGQAPMLDGRILSVAELSRHPEVMDRLPTRFESEINFPAERGGRDSTPYPSHYFFAKDGYKLIDPGWYYKTATSEQSATSRWYGWNYYRFERDGERKLSSGPIKYEPSRPKIQTVDIGDGKAKIAWSRSDDKDVDLIGYRVFVSESSRGWNHHYFTGGESAKKYWRGGWSPEMYDSLFSEPPSDVALITTSKTAVEIKLHKSVALYITIMPFDKYGESIGRKLYNMSEELELVH